MQSNAISPKAKGNTLADLSLNATTEKFKEPTSEEAYNNAVSLIKSRLSHMSPINALFTLTLAPNHPSLLIDATKHPATLTQTPSLIDLPATVAGRLHARPHMIQRWIAGQMEARYSLSNSHIYPESGTPPRIAVKFVDALTPFGATHPKLDPEIVPRLPKPTEDVRQVRRDVEEFGYGLLKNALGREELGRLKRRLMEQAKGEAEAGVAFFDGGESKPNQRVWNLPNKGQEFIDLLESNPTFENFVPEFLGDDAYLFSYTANIARPGNTPMHLHTDQITIQPPIRDIAFGLNFMFFLTDVTPELGGTLVMPGSHRGNLAPDDPYDAHTDTVAASGPAGTCMVFESRLWHATGSNTVPGSERPVVIVFFMRPFVRQQENWALSLREDVLERCGERVKGWLGFRVVGSMGGVEGRVRDGGIVGRVERPIGVLGGSSRL